MVVGKVLVRTGDQIVADRDGAVVVPAGAWPAVRAEAAALAGREEKSRAGSPPASASPTSRAWT